MPILINLFNRTFTQAKNWIRKNMEDWLENMFDVHEDNSLPAQESKKETNSSVKHNQEEESKIESTSAGNLISNDDAPVVIKKTRHSIRRNGRFSKKKPVGRPKKTKNK